MLCLKPFKGQYIVGAYKELLKLLDEQFEDDLLQYKERFNLNDDDWKIVVPYVRETMRFEAGRVDLPIMINNYLWEYINSKTPEGQATILKRFKEIYGKREGEKMTRKTIEFHKRLRCEVSSEV